MGFTTFPRNEDKKSWTKPSFTSLNHEPQPTNSYKLKKRFNSISSLVEEQQQIKEEETPKISGNDVQPRFNSLSHQPRFNSIESEKPKPRFKKNSISTLVEQQTVIEETKQEEEEEELKPRFSMFGKKAKFTEINNRSLEQDQKAIEANAVANAKKKQRFSGKFEYHPSTSKQQKKRKTVQFNPVFLERVCLFLEEQSPCELKEAHDKQLSNPPFRIICSHWPSSQDTTILLYKKSFSISPDNNCIKGKLMIRNLALDKSVLVRYTFDSWTTVRDVDAIFFGPNPKHTAYDIYDFTMDLDHRQLADRGELRGKLEFAIRCTMGDDDYWDNNDGKNYQIKILADPLNDPWKKKLQPPLEDEDSSTDDTSSSEEEEMDDVLLQETEKRKHSQFATALKGYKHAKPYHLNRRQPWLGTRYDFSQSLYLAKVAPYDTWTPVLEPDPNFIADCMPEPMVKESKENTTSCIEPVYPSPTSISALPSPTASPTASPTFSPSNDLEFNSAFYLNLLNKYCFYTSNDENTSTLPQTPLQPFIEEDSSPYEQL